MQNIIINNSDIELNTIVFFIMSTSSHFYCSPQTRIKWIGYFINCFLRVELLHDFNTINSCFTVILFFFSGVRHPLRGSLPVKVKGRKRGVLSGNTWENDSLWLIVFSGKMWEKSGQGGVELTPLKWFLSCCPQSSLIFSGLAVQKYYIFTFYSQLSQEKYQIIHQIIVITNIRMKYVLIRSPKSL